jgi:phosphatidate cytidylyltransferase
MAESPQPRPAEQGQFLQRVLVILVLLPLGLGAMYIGGSVFALLIALILGLAAYEYVALFKTAGYQPAVFIAIIGVVTLAISQHFSRMFVMETVFTLSVMLAMIYHLLEYENGRDQAAADFAVTTSAIVYIGFGVFLTAVRDLPEGMWWLLVVLFSIWLADVAAYLVGVSYGRHKMTTRLSPKKSWEGYLAGIVFSTLAMILVTQLLQSLGAGSAVTPLRAGILAAVISILCIFGDLGESMIKRQAGVKDSGSLLPGHGGIFDRIDSWLWAGMIGYIMITLFFT